LIDIKDINIISNMNIKLQILDIISDDINDEMVISIYGKSDKNENIVVNIIDFKPFFYMRIPDSWKNSYLKSLFSNTTCDCLHLPSDNVKVNSDDMDFEIMIEYGNDKYHNFYGYERDEKSGKEKLYNFVKFRFSNHTLMKKTIKVIKDYYKNSKENKKFKNDTNRQDFVKLNNEDGEFRLESNLYESNIHPLLRFIHDRDIKPSGWVEFDYDESHIVKEDNKIFNCDIQFDNIPYNVVKYYECDELSKYVIGSFDIECDSSHGDFPAARKGFTKTSADIVDYLMNDGSELPPGIIYLYIKKFILENIKYKISKDDLDTSVYIRNGIYDEESLLSVFLEEKVNGELDIGDKTYNMKKLFTDFYKLLKDNKRADSVKKMSKLLSLLKNNDKQLLKVMGDPIIQIGTVFYTYGKEDSYERYILVIGPEDNMDKKEICDDLDGIIVQRYPTEKDMLEGWVELVKLKNPDYITGYNIFGFDFEYIMGRVEELYSCNQYCKCSYKWTSHTWNCPTNRFYQLGRLLVKPKNDSFKHHKEKRCKRVLKNLSGKNADEDEKSYMDNTLKYIHMDGRIIFDVLNEVKKGYSLDSYKLDNVASHFMRGEIKGIRQKVIDEQLLVWVDTDRKGNLKNGDYISFNIKNNYGDMKYKNGEKYKIVNISNNKIKNVYTLQLLVSKKLNRKELIPKKINDVIYSEWCLNKDDISPKELFDKHKWGNSYDRSLIAKYCIMDCELCIHLLIMLDFIPNNIGMSNVCSVPQPYIFLRGQGIKVQSIVTKFSHLNGYKIPTLKQYDENDSDNSGFEGAIVLEPKTGIYLDDPIAVVDYASLYPSSIIEKNISHDTYLGEYNQIKDEEWFKSYEEKVDYNRIEYDNYKYVQKSGTSVINKEKDTDKPVVDCVFLTEERKKGIIPRVLNELLSARSRTKKLLKLEKDGNKKKILDGMQLAYKLTANSVYGQMGAKTSCLSFKKVAACTTAIGRQKIIDAKKYAYDWVLLPENNHIYNPLKEKHGDRYQEYYNSLKGDNEDEDKEKLCLENGLLDVIYGDTDSIFIKFSREVEKDKELTKLEAVDHCIDCGMKVGSYITSKLKEDNWPEGKDGYPQDLEYEKTFWPFILISKKRYTGEKYEFSSKEIPDRTSMGLVTKRRDNAPIVKYIFGNMVNRLMSATSISEVVNWLTNILDRIVEGKEHISMFIVSKTLNSYYKNPKGIAHKVLADKIGEKDPGNKPKANDRIPYLFVKIEDKPIITGYKTISTKEPTGEFKMIKTKVATGQFKLIKKKVPDGLLKNGKPKQKTIMVPGKIQIFEMKEVKGAPIMKTVKCRGPPIYKKQHILQGERIEHPDYMDWGGVKKEIDYKHYISNQIMNPVKQLLDISMDPEETSNLFNKYLQ